MIWRRAGLLLAVLGTESSCRTASEAPLLVAIDPDWVYVGRLPTPVRISGEGLLNRVSVSVDNERSLRVRGSTVRIGELVLDDSHVESSSEITATVPAGLEPGTYDVEVTLGNGQSAKLTQVFRVLEDDATAPVASAETKTTTEASETQTTNSVANCTSGTFATAKPIWETPTGPDYGPALADNGLMLLFSRVTDNGEELHVARRASLDAPFGSPTKLDELSTGNNTTPVMTTDQLRIVFTSDRSGSPDLWQGVRNDPSVPFATVKAIPGLNTDRVETRPWLSSDGLTIYFESNRDDATGSDIWQAKRIGIDDPFDTPMKLVGVNTSLSEGSPSFTADNLHLFYLSELAASPGKRSLFEARRPGSEQTFDSGTLIDSLAEYDMDGYASVSTDGREVVFSAKGEQIQQLWHTVRECE